MKLYDIEDGHGNFWCRCKLGADCGLKVIEAGKAWCWCQDQESSRTKVQAACEEIAKLEDDNERLRELVSTLGAPNHVGVPVEQWKALRADKARLDSGTILLTVCDERVHHVAVNLRAAIDAARKEEELKQ